MAVFHINVSTHDSKFTNIVANSRGGALFSNKSGIVNISESDFGGNTAKMYCGVAMLMFKSTLLIIKSTFSQNSAVNRYGGALSLLEFW